MMSAAASDTVMVRTDFTMALPAVTWFASHRTYHWFSKSRRRDFQRHHAEIRNGTKLVRPSRGRTGGRPGAYDCRTMRIGLDQQRSTYRTHAREAAHRLLALLEAQLEELVELGYERAFDTVGVHEYGDSTYWKTAEQLDDEAAAELADAIFYLHIPLARERGELPPLSS